jgi:hypothetical protein
MQMLFGWISPLSLRLKFDSPGMSRCTDCKGCDKACFMGVVPRRNKRDISCVNCGACIDACNNELGNGNGLFYYSFGEGALSAGDTCKPMGPQGSRGTLKYEDSQGDHLSAPG